MENIILKLSKILALTKSPVEGEAQAATEMLLKLLAKHNLEMGDLEAGGAEAPKVEREGYSIGRGDIYQWRYDLAEILADHCFCYPLVNARARSIAWVGRPDNVEALKMLYKWVADQLVRLSREGREAHLAETGEVVHNVRWQKAFCEGALRRLRDRLAELKARQQADVQTNALVVHHMSEISDWLEDKFGYRKDGQDTKATREWREGKAKRDAADAALLAADPAAYYERYPQRHPAAVAAEAARSAKEQQAWEKRQAANERARERARQNGTGGWGRYRKQEDWATTSEKLTARSAGKAAADKVNLSPFIDKTGEQKAALR